MRRMIKMEEKIEYLLTNPDKATKKDLEQISLYLSGCNSFEELEAEYAKAFTFLDSPEGKKMISDSEKSETISLAQFKKNLKAKYKL